MCSNCVPVPDFNSFGSFTYVHKACCHGSLPQDLPLNSRSAKKPKFDDEDLVCNVRGYNRKQAMTLVILASRTSIFDDTNKLSLEKIKTLDRAARKMYPGRWNAMSRLKTQMKMWTDVARCVVCDCRSLYSKFAHYELIIGLKMANVIRDIESAFGSNVNGEQARNCSTKCIEVVEQLARGTCKNASIFQNNEIVMGLAYSLLPGPHKLDSISIRRMELRSAWETFRGLSKYLDERNEAASILMNLTHAIDKKNQGTLSTNACTCNNDASDTDDPDKDAETFQKASRSTICV